ncbi:uncharacterized protein FIESC28_01472 [Fusarium coffeatum]|uniref:Uncharacterized protein n=1 Tax=Fusarium coffeatum TaxID=231269 RepID=A0A366S8V6_9HYPO|nr:uncharacterized protein FIESC28_01472 [Fusarium coffeatum]RBR25719.1 hypothetical protein FIESC28_01472 [Fusarium coffeatum]
MSKLVNDVKSGIKGIHGAGEALRGNVLEATDQAFHTDKNDPSTLKKETDNKIVAEKGKQDMKDFDNTLARREHEHRGMEPPAHVGKRETEIEKENELRRSERELERVKAQDRPKEGLSREPGTILPGETSTYGTGRTDDDVDVPARKLA